MMGEFFGILFRTNKYALVIEKDRQGMPTIQLVFTERDCYIGAMRVITDQINKERVATSGKSRRNDTTHNQGQISD